MKKMVRLGSRGSRLAVIQAESVIALMKQASPDIDISLVKVTTAGDRDRHGLPGQFAVGAFVKELEEALLDGRIDAAVHSLKDLPVELPAGLLVAATAPRLDPRDALVARDRLDNLAPGSRIGTGSPRRAVQLLKLRPDLEVCGMRGNVPTRLQKVQAGLVDGVIVAAAALLRLGLEKEVTSYFEPDNFLPAVGQGALAIETRSADREILDIIKPVNHLPTWQCVSAERAFLRALGGGCRAPIAALALARGGRLTLEGMCASADGASILRLSEEGSAEAAEKLGQGLANKMLAGGANRFIAEAEKL